MLLIAGGAVLAGWLALRQSQTETYLMVDDTIHYGQQIDRGDLAQDRAAAARTDFVPAGDADEVVGAYAQVELVPDTVLADGMYGDAPSVADDEAIVGLELDPSQFPKTFRPGDPVDRDREQRPGPADHACRVVSSVPAVALTPVEARRSTS